MTTPNPYLSLEELARLVPFSEQALRNYIHRGELCEGVHFFRRGRRLVFKWAAVCAWIEGRPPGEGGSITEAEVKGDIVSVRRRA